MIMKRKLPSQTGKLDEDLLEKKEETEAEQKQTREDKTPEDKAPTETGASGSASDAPQEKQTEEKTPPAPKEEASEDNSDDEWELPEEGASKAAAQSSTPPTEDEASAPDEPSEIPDPFVRGGNDDDMMLATPPGRPSSEADGEGVKPRQHKVSTEALVGDDKAQSKAPEAREPLKEKPASEKQYDSKKDTDKSEEDLSTLFPEGKDTTVTPEGDPDDDTWDLGDLVDVPEEQTNIGGSPFEGPASKPDASPTQQEGAPPPEAEKLPPWKRKRDEDGDKGSYTPKLPQVARKAPSKIGALVSLALVVLLIGGTAAFYQNRDAAVETISKWTGTLNEVGQPVPPETQAQGRQDGQQTAQQNGRSGEGPGQAEPEPQPVNRIAQDEQPDNTASVNDAPRESTISMEVLDVSPEEADEPIVAGDDMQMPEDVDKFTALQQAISEKRAERRTQESARLPGEEGATDPGELTPQEITKRNLKIIRQTNASLAEYRRALAEVDDPALKPRPGQFLDEQRQGADGTLPPPSQQNDQQARQQTSQQQQQPKLYGNKVVSDLSELVAEKQEQDSGVRMLEDFDVSIFEPNRPRVSIPKGITPRLSKEDFPKLEVLSFVPGQGVIGKTRGQEGVLLLGETLEGWELVDVYSNYAEFQKNGKKRIVTYNDANR